jgi:hypothetical protein
MRITAILIIAAAAMSTIANASDVRRSALPDSLQGTWAPSAEACGKSDQTKLVIATKKYTRGDAACDIFWVTVTAAPNGSNYSAHARCIDQSTGKAYPPSNLLFRPTDSDHISVGAAIGKLTPYQRCP